MTLTARGARASAPASRPHPQDQAWSPTADVLANPWYGLVASLVSCFLWHVCDAGLRLLAGAALAGCGPLPAPGHSLNAEPDTTSVSTLEALKPPVLWTCTGPTPGRQRALQRQQRQRVRQRRQPGACAAAAPPQQPRRPNSCAGHCSCRAGAPLSQRRQPGRLCSRTAIR